MKNENKIRQLKICAENIAICLERALDAEAENRLKAAIDDWHSLRSNADWLSAHAIGQICDLRWKTKNGTTGDKN